MKIISVNDDRYLVLGTVSASKVSDLAKTPSQLKDLYTLADVVLKNDNTYYICNKIIEVEWKEVNT